MKEINILLVDDDEINRLVAVTFLRKWDIRVTVAINGVEAVELVKSKLFQMVMMDLHMPEMDGYECTRQIRAMDDPYYKNIPIIVFSASYTIDSKRKAMEHGMTDFMNKPFRHEELQEKIFAYANPLIAVEEAGEEDFRPLKIDFDQHTDGDPVFKAELGQLLIENLTELWQSAEAAISQKDPQIFLKACHKVYTAITMLDDTELTELVDSLRASMRKATDGADKELMDETMKLKSISAAVSKSLERELNNLRKNSTSK
jgi:CheY-like chemotaxis protein